MFREEIAHIALRFRWFVLICAFFPGGALLESSTTFSSFRFCSEFMESVWSVKWPVLNMWHMFHPHHSRESTLLAISNYASDRTEKKKKRLLLNKY